MITGTIIFILGLCIGSFLNVCIYRIPKNESIVYPPSHCISCNKAIPWYDNIPLISFIVLNGECRFCKNKISFQYFLVEALTGILFLSLCIYFKLSPLFFIYGLLLCALIVATFIDFKYQIIPDRISYGGMIMGIILSLIYPPLHGTTGRFLSLRASILGLLAGGLSIYVLGVIGKIIFRKDAMGDGDVKLLAMIGSFLGWKKALIIFFIAPIFGSIVGIVLKIRYKVDIIPYGPYLSLATFVTILWVDRILGWILV